jgi:hypothetical protein
VRRCIERHGAKKRQRENGSHHGLSLPGQTAKSCSDEWLENWMPDKDSNLD